MSALFQISVLHINYSDNLSTRFNQIAIQGDDVHHYLLKIEDLITAVPSHLLFDLKFLGFLYGKVMLPDRSEPFTQDDFPFNVPPFSVTIKIMKKYIGWNVLYSCKCHDKLSLQCMSRVHVLTAMWMDCIHAYLARETALERNPIMVTKFDDLPGRRYGESENPIEHIYYIIEYFYDSYAVGRDGNHYYVYVDARYARTEVKYALHGLLQTVRKLPFYLTMDCYPVFKVTYDLASEYDDLW